MSIKGFFATIGLISCICLTGCKEQVPVTIENVQTEKKDVLENECAYLFVYNGYKMSIPLGYNLCITENGTPMVFNDNFQMLLAVSDTPFEDNTVETITKKIQKSKLELSEDVKTGDCNGISYINGKVLKDDKCIYFTYGNIKDTINAQTTVLNQAFTEEELLTLFTNIASSAIQTDAPNTTQDDLDQQSNSINITKDKCTLYLGDKQVTLGVGSGYKSSFVNMEENSNTEAFGNQYHKVNLSFLQVDAGAESYIKVKSNDMRWTKPKKVDINGHTYYYTTYTEDQNDELQTVQIVTATDVDGGIVSVTGYSYGNPDNSVTIDDIKEFMYIYD